MLLQELKRDTNTLLNTTGATREQLETFLQVTRTDLSELLYKQSSYNLFKQWINTRKTKQLLFVSAAMIEYLADKYNKGQQYTKGEMINCYAYDSKTKKYISCINSNGNCFIEEYNSIRELQEDFN